jgi:hypothetical protein
MARDENPPFDRGHTYYDGETIDTNDLGGVNLEGKEWVFEDVHPTTGVARTGRSVRCRIVRNTSGANMLPKLLARFETDGTEYGSRVDGYTATLAQEGYPIDEYLPAAGVPTNDLFWIVIEGPATCITTQLPAADSTVFSVGDWVVAETAVTSQQVTLAGHIEAQITTGGHTDLLRNQIMNRVGRALSAATTADTGTDILVDVGHW